MKKNTKAFLLEYLRLCRKYKVCIGACGCCNSPFIIDGGYNEYKHETDKWLIKHLIEEERRSKNK